MLVSVVTVCLNSAATIGKTLQSVAQQSWPQVEHIVIDGGSTDATLAVIRDSGARLAHLVSEPDRGIYDAMNKGLARARGDVVCFLNADDAYTSPDVLRTVVEQMAAHHLDALYGDVEFFDPGAPDKVVRRYRSARFRHQRLAYGWMPAHPALFLRRQVFERYGQFRPEYRIAGDFEFIARAFHGGHLRYRHLPQVLVRMQSGGVSTSGGLRGKLLLNREVLRACRDNGIPTNMLKILSRYPAKVLELFDK